MRIFFKSMIVCVLVFLPELVSADLNFFTRFLLSDKAYAKQIEVKMYILTDKQASNLLADPTTEPAQLLSSELAKFSKRYLVVRVKNIGDKHAWGTLACSVPRVWQPVKVPIISIRQNFCDYVICLQGLAVAESYENFIPELSYEWDQLYTK